MRCRRPRPRTSRRLPARAADRPRPRRMRGALVAPAAPLPSDATPAAGWCRCGGRDRPARDRTAAAFAARRLCAARRAGLARTRPARRRAGLSRPGAGIFPNAARMQRATADLLGIAADGAADHAALARPRRSGRRLASAAPRCRDAAPARAATTLPADYPFVRVDGDGVHEIAVGPVHAGIIEPGHFRFSVVGEKVLRLEERLGYTHKGIERRFTELPALEAHRLAGRVSGDIDGGLSPGPTAWRWSRPAAATCPTRARWLRALMLERERVANHLGDLGALGNDAALAFGLAQFSRLREDWQRASMHGLRPPLDDGLASCPAASPSIPTPRRWPRSRASATRSRPSCARCAQHLRRTRRPAGPLHRHRPGDAGAGRAARPDRAGRPRQRAVRRSALRLPVGTLRPAAR